MHILYLHYLFSRQDGTRDRTRHFLDAIRDLGHRVDVHGMNLADTGDAASDTPSPRARLRAALKRRFKRYLHEPKELSWNLPYWRRQLALLREVRPDVLIVRPQSLNISPLVVARRLGLPLVLEMHAPVAELLQSREYLHLPWISNGMEAWRLRHADVVTVVSSSLGHYFVERYGLPAAKVVRVPNGADLTQFYPGMEVDPEAATRLAGGPVVGFVGSFQEWHGSALLARLVREVATARAAARFLMVGDGPSAGELRQATAELGERALFTGWVPHTRARGLVGTLDIGVLPESDFYRCPLKLIEWMAAGIAVVLPRHAPLEELVQEGVEGLFFEPGDAAGLVRQVLRLVDDPALRQSLGAAAATRVQTSMTWHDSARRLVEACELARQRQALTGRSRTPPYPGSAGTGSPAG